MLPRCAAYPHFRAVHSPIHYRYDAIKIMEANTKLEALSDAASSENVMQHAPDGCIADKQATVSEAIEIVYRGRLGLGFPVTEEASAEETEALTKSEKSELKKLEKVFERELRVSPKATKPLTKFAPGGSTERRTKPSMSIASNAGGSQPKRRIEPSQPARQSRICRHLETSRALKPKPMFGHSPLSQPREEQLEAIRRAEQKANGKEVTSKNIAESVKE